MAPCKTISLQQMSTGSSPTPGNASLTLHSQGSCVPVGSGTRTPLPVPPLTLMWPWWVEDRGGNHSCLRSRARHYHTVALGEAGGARIESARKAVGGSLSLHSTCGEQVKMSGEAFGTHTAGEWRILPSVYCLGSAGIIMGMCVRVLNPFIDSQLTEGPEHLSFGRVSQWCRHTCSKPPQMDAWNCLILWHLHSRPSLPGITLRENQSPGTFTVQYTAPSYFSAPLQWDGASV